MKKKETGVAKDDPLKVRTILLIEDDGDDAELVRKLLKPPHGPTDKMIHVENLTQAKESLSSLEIDAILLDLRLPGTEGVDCVRTIRKFNQDIPIIVLTGSDDDSLALDCIAEGAQDYLMKSELRPQSLRRALGYAITRSLEIFQRKLVNEELRTRDKHMRALTVRLNEVREAERTRISRAVHDQLGQILTGLKIDLNWMVKHIAQIPIADGNSFLKRLIEAQKLADSALETVHNIAIELRPSALDVLGLSTAIREEAHRFEKRTGIGVHVEILTSSNPVLRIAVELFRILQELLTNVVRHAKATVVRVILEEKNNTWRMTVEDDGIGFNLAEKSGPAALGLLGIKERVQMLNGSVEFNGHQGKGALAYIVIPNEKQNLE